jgi:hypothetical protein
MSVTEFATAGFTKGFMVTQLGQTGLDQWSLATKMDLVGDGDGDDQQAIASLNGGTGIDTLKLDGAGNGVSGEAPASEAGEVERLLLKASSFSDTGTVNAFKARFHARDLDASHLLFRGPVRPTDTMAEYEDVDIAVSQASDRITPLVLKRGLRARQRGRNALYTALEVPLDQLRKGAHAGAPEPGTRPALALHPASRQRRDLRRCRH